MELKHLFLINLLIASSAAYPIRGKKGSLQSLPELELPAAHEVFQTWPAKAGQTEVRLLWGPTAYYQPAPFGTKDSSPAQNGRVASVQHNLGDERFAFSILKFIKKQ